MFPFEPLESINDDYSSISLAQPPQEDKLYCSVVFVAWLILEFVLRMVKKWWARGIRKRQQLVGNNRGIKKYLPFFKFLQQKLWTFLRFSRKNWPKTKCNFCYAPELMAMVLLCGELSSLDFKTHSKRSLWKLEWISFHKFHGFHF